MKRFAFVNEAAEREYKALSEYVQDEFGKNLRRVQYGLAPVLAISHLGSIDAGVIELKINGSPAYRCVYTTKYLGAVIVLHAFIKTTNGVDRKAMQLVDKRLKELKLAVQNN